MPAMIAQCDPKVYKCVLIPGAKADRIALETTEGIPSRFFSRWRRFSLVQEVLPIQGVALGGAEASVADDAAEFFFGGAVGDAGGADYIFF